MKTPPIAKPDDVDTRSKILSGNLDLSRLADAGSATLLIGHFDVLRREHARAVEQAGHPLIAVVLQKADAILPLRARAELAAGLRAVNHVVTAAEAEVDGIVAAVQPARVLRLVEQERQWAVQLKDRARRHGAR